MMTRELIAFVLIGIDLILLVAGVILIGHVVYLLRGEAARPKRDKTKIPNGGEKPFESGSFWNAA